MLPNEFKHNRHGDRDGANAREESNNDNQMEETSECCVYSTIFFYSSIYSKWKSENARHCEYFIEQNRNVNNQSRWVIIGVRFSSDIHTFTSCVHIVWLFPIESKYKRKLHNLFATLKYIYVKFMEISRTLNSVIVFILYHNLGCWNVLLSRHHVITWLFVNS